MTTASSAVRGRSSGRLFLILGLVLPVLGVLGYSLQLALQRLTTPWYLPVAASVGAFLVLVALWQGRTLWRVLGLLLVLLIAGGEWAFLLGMRLPAYAGPVAQGQAFPAFETMRADGTKFTQRDLVGDKDQVLVFFRGRW